MVLTSRGFILCRFWMDDQKFTLEFHHGGLFAYIPQKIFASGKVELIEDVDPDRMSYFKILGVESQFMWRTPNLHAGDDEDMVSLGDKEDRVSLGDKEEEDSDGDSDFHAGSDYGSFSESDLEYFADGDMIFDEYENVGKGQKQREIKGKGKCFEIGSGSGKGKGSREDIVDIDEVENDDLNSPMNSDCEGGLDYPEFNEERDMGKPELKL
ncbi:hypothetical protein RHMOL_Rhmol09G0105500 [Rhododendron molle]|uniref:Uncharacterized protein n=1 Tax=Rhododendron molle TaxID=49168 RepID=A0ACC0MBM7_RHOML|nr:hypothetical protein RHMOL_Rhmol09G0105500 [Rhododendron molle]